MKNTVIDFLAGIVVGAVGGLLFMLVLAQEQGSMLRECEKNLPRTENCKLIAVPEK
jgi:gas vesicle protein